MGEKEEEDRILFTATSTPDQWKNQGDFFRRKGLWEPAMKCYHKAGDVLFEKEAQAYMYAQKAKVTGNPREVIGCFENAAFAFLYCDHLRHDVKFLLNAAKCLRNCRRHNDAAMLFEKLGEVCYNYYTCTYVSCTWAQSVKFQQFKDFNFHTHVNLV